jgi:hypothetical protein
MVFLRNNVATVRWKPTHERSAVILIAIDIFEFDVVRVNSTSILLCPEGNARRLTLFIRQKMDEFFDLCLGHLDEF